MERFNEKFIRGERGKLIRRGSPTAKGAEMKERNRKKAKLRSIKTKKQMNENPRVIPKKATEESFNELHYLVTEDFLRRIRSGEATVQDLKAACDWLKTNDITGVAYEGSPLDKLNKIIPTVDPSLVKRKVYGKNF